jgi:hypothetical protein
VKLPPYGPDGAGPVRRALRRSPVRYFVRVWWKHRGITPDDVIIASYPRAGNLWLRYMLIVLLTGDADIRKVTRLAPGLWNLRNPPPLLPSGGRIIKTHEQHSPVYRRAVHLVRDPRDVVISYFGLTQSDGVMKIPTGMSDDEALDRFVDAFMRGRLDAYGTWLEHFDSWSGAAAHGRVEAIRVRYEDLRADPVAHLGRVASFLGFNKSVEEITRAVELSTLEHMKAAALDFSDADNGRTRSPHPVVNRGQVGGWRDRLTDDQARRFAAFAPALRQLGYAEAGSPRGGSAASSR